MTILLLDGKPMPEADLFQVACDFRGAVSRPMLRDKALRECRKWNSIPAGQPNAGNYYIQRVKQEA